MARLLTRLPAIAGGAPALPSVASRPLSLLASRPAAPSLPFARPLPQTPSILPASRRWATKKTAGGTNNTKDSHSKHLGIKCFSGTPVDIGVIIVRQRGTKYRPGWGVEIGRDHTLVAVRPGVVRFWYDLPRSRHYVCVDDGSLPTPVLPSKDEAKKRLAKMVDLPKYMELRGEERHRYMLQLVRKYDMELRKEVVEAAERWISGEMIGDSKDSAVAAKVNGRRAKRLNLVDLTKL